MPRDPKWGITIMPRNHLAWAIYREGRYSARIVRKIVWGRALARMEKRPGEKIARASIATKL